MMAQDARGLGRSTCWASPTTGSGPRKGYWVVKQKHAANRFRRAINALRFGASAIGTNRFVSNGQHSGGNYWGTLRINRLAEASLGGTPDRTWQSLSATLATRTASSSLLKMMTASSA